MLRCSSMVMPKAGPRVARTALENFWRRVSEAARFSPLRRGPLDVILGRWTLDSSPISVAMDLMSRVVSPYDLNPMGKNPLRAILAETINFERLAQAPTKLFITATNVRTGRGHVFKINAVTPDVLLASACLPTMFQALEIDGEPYWDGAVLAIPRSRLSFKSASHRILFSFRSIRLNARVRRAPPQRFSTD
jgi:NTE family protein